MEFKTGSDNSKDRIKLKAGDSIKGVFMGNNHQFRQHWTDSKPTDCPGEHQCTKCANGEKASFRFKINLVVKENDTYIAKVWEQGWTVFLALKSLHEGGYDLEKYLMKISRTGSTKNDTVYSVVPVPNGLLTPEQLKELSKVKLISLTDEPTKSSKGRPIEPLEEVLPF